MPVLARDLYQEVLDDLLADGAGEDDLLVQDLRRKIAAEEERQAAGRPAEEPEFQRTLALLGGARKPK